MEKVCILGLGYIGLPTAGLLAAKGFKIHGVDVDEKVVDSVNHGNSHIDDPELNILVKSAVKNGIFTASFEPVPADIFIITVPALIRKDHLPDTTDIKMAVEAIAPYLTPGNLIILESTIPVGTTEKMAGWLSKLRPDLVIPTSNPTTSKIGSLYLAHCPERVLPDQVFKELLNNDRIIGGIDPPSAKKAQSFYRKFINGSLLVTGARTAELTKLVENSFRDVNIAFANELSLICNKLDINVWEVIELANRHPRVNILQPGPGVGGSCITVDPWFIVASAPGESRLIRAARGVNDSVPDHVLTKIKEKAAHFEYPVITCLGISYKANIGDLRKSPALSIVQRLVTENTGQILVVEPHIKTLPGKLAKMNNVRLIDLQSGLEKADLVVLLVNHDAFVHIDRKILENKIIIDTRGIWR